MTFGKNAVLLFVLVLGIQPILAKEKSFEFHFWTSKPTKLDKRVVRIEDHPCGEVAVARVSSMPKYSGNGALIPERVFELSPSNKILRQWSMPVDGDVIGVRDNSLFVSAPQGNYKIGLNGQIAQVENLPMPTQFEVLHCAENNPLLPSGYLACRGYKDISNGRTRILSYEMVCT